MRRLFLLEFPLLDRILVFPGQIPLDSDLLNTQRNTMLGLGGLAGAMLGINTQTVVSGLVCTPTAPTSMTVNVGPGSILQYMIVDGSSFGSLPADTTDSIQKMGINLASTPFTLTAPTTSGQTINYLIQASLIEADANPVTLPYYNSANPAQPFSGPNNSGTPQNTARTQRVQLQLKAGAPANAGTQVTPTVDNGWVGLWVISVNFGATSVVSGNIVRAASSPLLAGMLNSHHGGVPGQAPKINLANEVQGVLPHANIPVGSIQVFTASGTFTVPNDVSLIDVEVWGGGGGSEGANTGTNAVCGGGGGGYSRKLCSVTPGQIVAVTIGAGGAAGTSTPTAGGTGGTSSFGSFCSATGGTAGTNGSVGSGGSGSGGDENITGQPGNPYTAAPGSGTTQMGGGAGGMAPRGGGGGVAGYSPSGAGQRPGGGAGGPYNGASVAGQTGGAGMVVVRW